MNSELQSSLYKKYPKIFRQRDLSPQESTMCFGITCGNGWYNIIDNLCSIIKTRIRMKRITTSSGLVPSIIFNCEVVQVKSKFGQLRFYVEGGDDYIDGAIRMAEQMSLYTCQNCGRLKKIDSASRTGVCKKCTIYKTSDNHKDTLGKIKE